MSRRRVFAQVERQLLDREARHRLVAASIDGADRHGLAARPGEHLAIGFELFLLVRQAAAEQELGTHEADPVAMGDVDVIDVATHAVETPEQVAETIRQVLRHVEPERLYPSTNCGMVPLPREVARGKLRALGAGARLVRTELQQHRRDSGQGGRGGPSGPPDR